MKNFKSNPSKTVLTITVGFAGVYLMTKWQWSIYVSLIIGLSGIASDFLAEKIEWIWMKLSWLLSQIIPNIILSSIFYFFLFPIAVISRMTGNRDPLFLKKPSDSTFIETNKLFSQSSFEKTW